MNKRIEISSGNLLHWLVLLWWALVRPDRLKTYLSSLEEHSQRHLTLAGSWLVSTLSWLPLLIAGLWIGSNRTTVEAVIAWQGFSPWFFARLPWVLLALGGMWALTGRFGLDDSDGLSARHIVVELVVGLGIAFASVGLASLVTLSRVSLGIALGIAVSIGFSVSDIPTSKMARAVSVMAAFGTMLGVALSAAFNEAYTPMISGLMFLVAFTIMTGVTSAVDNALESGKPSWVGRAAFVALALSYGMLFWQLATGLVA